MRLNNGVDIPDLGFGTAAIESWQKDSPKVIEAVSCALKLGYRHIDTAAVYGNEKSIGTAIKNSSVAREDIFITSKVWMPDFGYESTLKAFTKTLERLDLKYLDLYLIHWPVTEKNIETWKAMEKLYKDEKIRAIGVSNFRPQDLEQLAQNCEVKPCCNQIEIHPYFTQKKLREYCREKDIAVVSWSPLGTGDWSDLPVSEKPINDAVIVQIAKKYNLSSAQIILKWHQQSGLIPIPKSQTPKHIEQNFQLDFRLDEEEMNKIDSLNKDMRVGVHPDEVLEKFVGVEVPAG